MKIFLTFLLLTFLSQSSFGQDKINTKDKQQLSVEIIEQTNKIVKYKMIDYKDGPILSIKTNRISSIEYYNGYVDCLGNQNPRKNKPFGINTGIGYVISEGVGMIGLNFDYFIIPQIDLEINFGTDLEYISYFSAGCRFHLNSNNSDNRFTPFTGLLFGAAYGVGFFQIPIGINYHTNLGFSTSLSLNEMISFEGLVTFLELRIGWKF